MEETRGDLAFYEAVDFAIDQEEAGIKIYAGYLGMTASQGLKQLLRSIISQEKDHVKRLAELKKAGDLSGFLAEDADLKINVDEYQPVKEILPGMPSAQFLSLVIRREGMAAELYQRLGSKTANTELSFLFQRLSGEEMKHKTMAQNRYELEALNPG